VPAPGGVVVKTELRVSDSDAVKMEEPSEGFPTSVKGVAEMVGDETTPDTEEVEPVDAEGVTDKSPFREAESCGGTRIIA
jgi:hypothetical protein